MARLASIALVALCALGFAGCFSVDRPICSYACSDTSPKCPDDYECRTDGYCHLVGTTASCSFADAAVQPLDMTMSTPPDLVSSTSD
jgi:hypothetical protein